MTRKLLRPIGWFGANCARALVVLWAILSTAAGDLGPMGCISIALLFLFAIVALSLIH